MDDELLDDFLQEVEDILGRVSKLLDDLKTRKINDKDIDSLFRDIHTVKGGAAMFSMEVVKNEAHSLETYLGTCKKDLDQFDLKYVQEQVDVIENKLGGGNAPSEDAEIDTKVPAESTLKDSNENIEAKATQEIVTAAPSEDENAPPSSPDLATTKKDVLRIPVEKVNRTLNNIWEILLLRNQIAYLFEKNKTRLKDYLDVVQEWEILDTSLRRNISDLETTAMSMRMNDMNSLFSRMKKMVRSYSKSTGKDIEIKTNGSSIELDKKVLDMLGEPFTHLIRNAIDHGIEDEATRIKLKKNPLGTITIAAQSLSDKVIITVQDDGKGIDSKKLLAKAKEKGMNVSHLKSEQDILNIIFQPGFTTAEKVSDVSGRGVGMDAVSQSITRLGGTVSLHTELGIGTTISIELPLSMSVVSSIIYEVNESAYASGINSIIEVCREHEDVIINNNGEHLFPYRGSFLPCYDLREHLHTDKQSESEMASLFILDVNKQLIALRVGKILRHTDIVVKEMKGAFPQIESITGVSILSTGQPIFILSLPNLYKSINLERNFQNAA